MNIGYSKGQNNGRKSFDQHLGNNERDVTPSLTEVSAQNLFNEDLVSRNLKFPDNELTYEGRISIPPQRSVLTQRSQQMKDQGDVISQVKESQSSVDKLVSDSSSSRSSRQKQKKIIKPDPKEENTFNQLELSAQDDLKNILNFISKKNKLEQDKAYDKMDKFLNLRMKDRAQEDNQSLN